MSRQTRVLTTCTALLLLATGFVVAETLEEKVDRTLTFAPGSRLEVSNVNGNISISSWDREEIRIEAVKKVRASGDKARELFDDVEIVINEVADGVTVETRHPSFQGWSWRGHSISVSYEITLPARADIELDTVNGKIQVSGVRGALDFETTNGGIDVEGAGGNVNGRTTNGSIEVALQTVDAGEDMVFRTTNGGITLSLPSDTRASFKARTTNGGISTDFPVTIQGSVSRNRLEGELNGGGGQIDLRTTNGAIKIRELG